MFSERPKWEALAPWFRCTVCGKSSTGLTATMPYSAWRLINESIHEIGHTLGLRHCQDYSCVMASSHSVEWIDLRESTLCDSCRYQLEASLSTAESHA
jgi:predicted Zn-dependent protease